jgi:hypothetical protein
MTDISESGIEAALLPCPFCGTACEVREVGHGRAAFKKIEHGTPGDDDKDGWKCPAIGWRVVYDGPKDLAAWNRRHPPASREEGLREAAELVRANNIVSSSEGEFLRARHEGNRSGLAYVDGILALIPTKPEAGESGSDKARIAELKAHVVKLEAALFPFAAFADRAKQFVTDRATDGGSPVMPTKHFRLSHFEAARAALQSKKPE